MGSFPKRGRALEHGPRDSGFVGSAFKNNSSWHWATLNSLRVMTEAAAAKCTLRIPECGRARTRTAVSITWRYVVGAVLGIGRPGPLFCVCKSEGVFPINRLDASKKVADIKCSDIGP